MSKVLALIGSIFAAALLVACGPTPIPRPSPTLTAAASASASVSASASPSDALTPMPAPASNFPCTNPAPTAAAPTADQLARYEAVITSANTQPMAAQSCDPLTLIIGGSECCGAIQRDSALSQWGNWLLARGPWTVGIDAATLATWQAGFYGQYVPNGSLIAVSDDGQWMTSVIFDGDIITGLFGGLYSDMSYPAP